MMKKLLLLFVFIVVFSLSLMANRTPIVIHQGGSVGDHIEHYIPADMPVVYFDSDEMEIIIVADGFANHYTVEVNSMVSGLTLIYTQIRGYGDTIDVSSLPDGYYQIIITSSNNNMFEGTFLIEKINRFLR